jgi:hypothetical protein
LATTGDLDMAIDNEPRRQSRTARPREDRQADGSELSASRVVRVAGDPARVSGGRLSSTRAAGTVRVSWSLAGGEAG